MSERSEFFFDGLKISVA